MKFVPEKELHVARDTTGASRCLQAVETRSTTEAGERPSLVLAGPQPSGNDSRQVPNNAHALPVALNGSDEGGRFHFGVEISGNTLRLGQRLAGAGVEHLQVEFDVVYRRWRASDSDRRHSVKPDKPRRQSNAPFARPWVPVIYWVKIVDIAFPESRKSGSFVLGRTHDDVGCDGIYLRKRAQNVGVKNLVVCQIPRFHPQQVLHGACDVVAFDNFLGA